MRRSSKSSSAIPCHDRERRFENANCNCFYKRIAFYDALAINDKEAAAKAYREVWVAGEALRAQSAYAAVRYIPSMRALKKGLRQTLAA